MSLLTTALALHALRRIAHGCGRSPAGPDGRVSWKYRSIACALILKHVGVLTQTFYLMATNMGLGACAIGSANIELFAKMTGTEFHIEGPVGRFAIGRSVEQLP